MKYIIVFIASLLIIGCSYEYAKESIVPKEEANFAREYLEQLRTKNYEYAKQYMHPKLRIKAKDKELEKFANYFPDGEPVSTELMGANVTVINGVWSADFSFESEFPKGWSVVSISMTKDDNKLLITSINVQRTDESYKVTNSFFNAELNFYKVLILGFTALVPIFMIYTCFLVYRTPIEKKFRWYLLSFVGVGGVAMNWTTGDVFIKVTTVKLLGFGAGAGSEFAPVVLSFTLPIGAVIFWFKRRKLTEQAMAKKNNQEDTE